MQWSFGQKMYLAAIRDYLIFWMPGYEKARRSVWMLNV